MAAHAQGPELSPDEIMRQTVTNELEAANDTGHYLYRLQTEKPRRTETYAVVETRDWLIKRQLLLDGVPLGAEQRAEQDRELRSLVADAHALRVLRAQQRKRRKRVRELVRALPEAFEYEFDGTEADGHLGEVIRLRFHPNRTFEPSSRELQVLQGMEGTVSVDASAHRLLRVEAKLFRRVNFGWGILGHLNEGGTFMLEQRDVGEGRWQVTRLALHFTGNIFFFKTLHIDSTIRTSHFQRVAEELTLTQGLELLLRQDEREESSGRVGAPRDPSPRSRVAR
jgi:hypothetical protein